MITVSKDSRGDYKTIEEALEFIQDDNKMPVKIFIYNGVYCEKVLINKPFLTLEGETVEETIITYNDNARMTMPDGELRGTFRTPTVMIDTNGFTAKNITFSNSAGPGYLVGQALALYVDGDYIEFDNCRFIGHQDTLFTAPLPQTPLQKNGFVGPKEHVSRVNGRHYYHNCYIEGTVDFIFGGATAYFDYCEIYSKDSAKMEDGTVSDCVKGYITAASTPKDQKYGYVFNHCNFTSDCPPNTVYLGRPWRNYANVVLIHCVLGKHIKDEGWDDWNKKEAHNTVFFAEYKSTGEGTDGISCGKRVPWSKQLSSEEALYYLKEKVYK